MKYSKMKSKVLSSMGFALSVALVGCGGGGGGASAPSTPGEAQGAYVGSFSSAAFPNGRFSTLVLENDEVWTLFGQSGASGEFVIYGLLQGQGNARSGDFSAASIKEFLYDGTSYSGSLTAKYAVGSNFNGLVSINGQSVSFAGVVPVAGSLDLSNYQYSSAPNVSDVAGNWSVTNLSGNTSTLTITNAGTFSGTNQNGCGFSGTVVARSSGKNVFDVTTTNNTSVACGSYSGLSLRGIGVTSMLPSAQRQIIFAFVNADRSMGGVAIGRR